MVIAYFTPVTGASGGAILGVACGILLLYCGEVLGASSIVSSIGLHPRKAMTEPGSTWKLCLVSAFMLIGNTVLARYFTTDYRLIQDPSIPIVSNIGYLIGGFLVGFGTRLSNGCTTGHGFCGMARLSKRSIVAVVAFMVAGVATASLLDPKNSFASATSFLRTDKAPELFNQWVGLAVTLPMVLGTVYALHNLRKSYQGLVHEDNDASSTRASDDPNEDNGAAVKNAPDLEGGQTDQSEQRIVILDGVKKLKPAAVAGMIFSSALAIGGVVLPSKISGCLNVLLIAKGTWDPTLMALMMGGLSVSWISYQFVSGIGVIENSFAMERPKCSSDFELPKNQKIDILLTVGALCFGAGWALAGVCPGTGLFLAASGCTPVILFFWPLFFVGAFVAQAIDDRSWCINSCRR
ncbi:unnamed protein product [Cylindrotheca closterium]|uniref:Sulphur transport domain-containing protein n=1 Tax=Cylindrotheca closterium TaxID=2856 RepID=A0AAD2G540_9STRA|nr:unnamed protein product [Cylindrotheca closterium]